MRISRHTSGGTRVAKPVTVVPMLGFNVNDFAGNLTVLPSQGLVTVVAGTMNVTLRGIACTPAQPVSFLVVKHTYITCKAKI